MPPARSRPPWRVEQSRRARNRLPAAAGQGGQLAEAKRISGEAAALRGRLEWFTECDRPTL